MSPRLKPEGFDNAWLALEVETHESLDSTNERAWKLADAGGAHGRLVVAGRQTAGRGRQGRSWQSEPGNLFASFVLRPASRRGVDPSISLVVGLEIAATLREDLGLEDVGLKWPNDVWLAGRKVAGVLVEGKLEPVPRLVVGFGVNLRAPAKGWGALDGVATSVDVDGPSLEPADFLERLLPRLENAVDDFVGEGFAPRMAAWSDYDVLIGRRISYVAESGSRSAIVDGVDEHGQLHVLGEDGSVHVLRGGEVHLTGAAT